MSELDEIIELTVSEAKEATIAAVVARVRAFGQPRPAW